MAKRRKPRGKYPGLSLYRRDGRTWYLKYKDPNSGKDVRVNLHKQYGVTTLREAERVQKELYESFDATRREAAVTGPRTNVDEDWDTIENRYLEKLKSERGEATAIRTSRDWLRIWRLHRDQIALKSGNDLKRAHLGEFRNLLGQKRHKLASATRNRHLNAVRAMLHVARGADCIRMSSDDINEQLKPFKVVDQKPTILTQRELRRILRYLPEYDLQRHIAGRDNKAAYQNPQKMRTGTARFKPWGPFVLLAMLTGARPGEVLRIRHGDTDWERGVLGIHDSKRSKFRELPLADSPCLQQVIRGLEARVEYGGFLCADKDPNRLPVFNRKAWDRFRGFIGLADLNAKDLRSTCVAHVASASKSTEYMLTERFGHSVKVSVRHYRQPQHGAANRGESVEDWLGIANEMHEAIHQLELVAPVVRKRGNRIVRQAVD